jgi:hypothetical protein
MTKLILLMCLLPAVALATVDPDPDQIGIYFDLEANEACVDAVVNVPFFAYMIITNPTTEVRGLSYCLTMEFPAGGDGLLFSLEIPLPEGCHPPLNPGYPAECGPKYMFTCSGPLVPTGGNVVVRQFQFLLLADVPVNLHLGSVPPGFGAPLAYLGPDQEWIPLGVSSGSPDLPVAQINGDCMVVETARSTFGRIKATYR